MRVLLNVALWQGKDCANPGAGMCTGHLPGQKGSLLHMHGPYISVSLALLASDANVLLDRA